LNLYPEQPASKGCGKGKGSNLMDIITATNAYEEWGQKLSPFIRDDLELKHRKMKESEFMFLRATFYRWVQLWPEVCGDLTGAPVVLAVGDLHVENFGTWRDAEGRLVWGINDVDEAYPLPYTNDLVRLATSVLLASREDGLGIGDGEACTAILEGYLEGIESAGSPFVLEEHHPWLREVALNELRDPGHFWKKMDSLSGVNGEAPATVVRLLEGSLPHAGIPYRLVHRIAGLGSLGRQRYVAIAEWRGGLIAREAKALLPSAAVWAQGKDLGHPLFYEKLLEQSVRCCDPFVHLKGSWLLRRLAPHCSRIELSSLPREHDERKLIKAMGFETANVHLGSRDKQSSICHDLEKRSSTWLHDSAKAMADAVSKDRHDWSAG
jgi:hypothetical protein